MASRKFHSILVKQIPWTADKSVLKDYFSKFGNVAAISLPFDKSSGLHKGHAVVFFLDRESCQKAMDARRHTIDHYKIIVSQPLNLSEKEEFD